MTQRLTVPLPIYQALMAHALREAPWECCGLLGGVGEAVQSCHPLTNRALTPQTHYFASPEDLFPAMRSLREAGETLLAIYHSHPVGDPFPSETDLELAFYPQVVYLIVGPLHPEPGFSASPPEVRGFLLGGPEVQEVEVELEGRAEERRQILVDLLPQMGSAHPSEPDLSLGEEGASSAPEPPPEAVQLPPDKVSVGSQAEVVSVDALPEQELAETPLVVPEELELVEEGLDEAIVEPPQMTPEEVAPVDNLPEEAPDNTPLVAQEEVELVEEALDEAIVEPPQMTPEEVTPIDELPEEASDNAPLVVQEEVELVAEVLDEAIVEPPPVTPEEVAPVDELPEEASDETPLVVAEEVGRVAEVLDEAPVEPLPVIQEAVEAIDELPEEASDEAPLIVEEAVEPVEDASEAWSDEALQESIAEPIPPAVEPVPQLTAEETGSGAPEEAAGGWASRLTRKIRSAIARVTRWAFSGRDRQ
ncbi:MAG: Mov34/MPN/PAD-1 family protein [Blastocatellia bacterium]